MRIRLLLVVLACGGALPACAHEALPARSAAFVPVDAVASPATGTAVEPLGAWLKESAALQPIVDNAPDYRFEVLLSVPDPAEPRWTSREGFRVDAEYFYPASAIKLCIATAALETISELRESGAGVDARTPLTLDVRHLGRRRRNPTATSIASAVDRALVLSDNGASNLLFDFVGSDALHERMDRIGLPSVRVRHRLGGTRYDPGRETPAMALVPARTDPVLIPARTGSRDLGVNEGAFVGDGFFAHGRIRKQPMSFEERNRIGLQDLQDLLVSIVRPDLREPHALPHLGDEEHALLVDSLQSRPSDRGARVAVDTVHKPLLAGIERVVPASSVLVTSKSGRAYGFMVDNAFVVDLRSQRSFFLTAVLYANANGLLNDDDYEYESIAFPLFAELGELAATRVFAGTPSTADAP